MEEKQLLMMNVIANVINSYYDHKISFCLVNQSEPDHADKDDLLKRCISMFENLSTSYLGDIQEITEQVLIRSI